MSNQGWCHLVSGPLCKKHKAEGMEHGVRSQKSESRIQEKGNQDLLLVNHRFFEPQNVESASGGNIEVITSSFCGFLFCCSIFSG